jgi:hypothetical protein
MQNMKKYVVLLLAASAALYGTDATAQSIKAGQNKNAGQSTKDTSKDVSDNVLVELYRGARVTDVVDGMATVGYTGVGVMDPKIAPLWKDVETMQHRFSGIAVTVRYGPTNRPMYPGADLTKPENYQAYRDWRGMWYSQLSTEPFQQFLKPGYCCCYG